MKRMVKMFLMLLMVGSGMLWPALAHADRDRHDHGHWRHHGHRHHGHSDNVHFNFSFSSNDYYRPYYYRRPVVVERPIFVERPVVVQQPVIINTPLPEDSFTVKIPNDNGSYTAVTLRKSGNGYVGPQGEFYERFPTLAQLKAMYGK